MMRSIVCGASCVCSVANTRWPVSAAVIAVEIVSRSRISPTRITSGSWRRTCLSAWPKPCVSAPTSRWFTMQLLCLCRNSIGSSTVMMWPCRSVLTTSTIEASVVDLPEPVGPVTTTNPRGNRARSATTGGRPSVVDVLDLEGDHAERGPDRVALHVDVHAEARAPGQRVGHVELELLLEAFAQLLGQDRVDHALQRPRRERRHTFSTRSSSPCTRTTGGGPRREVQVRAVQVQERTEELRDRDLRVVFVLASSCSSSLHHPCYFLDGGDPHAGLLQAVVAERDHALLRSPPP